MKILIFFFFCLYLNVSIGQDTSSNKIDLKNYLKIYATAGDSAVYVIDGNVYNKKLEGINPDDIIFINVIKKEKAAEWFSGSGRNGIVIVVTKTTAIKVYQRKLSNFSKKYCAYLQSRKGSDNNILYMINGIPLSQSVKIKTLYNVPAETIKSVKYSDNLVEGMNSGATIFITTKQ